MAKDVLRGWMIDFAREQAQSVEVLSGWLRAAAESGYTAVGLYLEHRFAWAVAPWANGPGCLNASDARQLSAVARGAGIRLIPFLNTLGHMEGFIRAEGGQWLAEGPRDAGTLQLCPSRPECRRFVAELVDEAVAAFDDSWLHLGGDETHQLGQCPQCAAVVAERGKAGLYGDYYGWLCRLTLDRGRRPCLWADMLLAHPAALDHLPRETVLFDWQYTASPTETSRRLRDAGFDVACCPSVQTYNSGWCFWPETQANIDAHADAVAELGALGVFVTSWEFCNLTNYAATLPLILAAGRRLRDHVDWDAALEHAGGSEWVGVSRLLGTALPRSAGLLAPTGWRTLRDRLVLRGNPFDLWRAWREDACGPVGDQVLALCDQAAALLPDDHALHWPIRLHRAAVYWVRRVEQAALAWRRQRHANAVAALVEGRAVLAALQKPLNAIADAGGSAVDPVRLERLLAVVDAVRARIGSATPIRHGYRPSFETLTRLEYVSGDQAAWGSVRSGPV